MGIDLCGTFALCRQFGCLYGEHPFADRRIQGIHTVNGCLRIFFKQLLCHDIAGIDRPALFGGTGDINNIAPGLQIPAEYPIEFFDGNLRRGNALSGADGFVKSVGFIRCPSEKCRSLFAVLDCGHSGIVNVVCFKLLCAQVGAGIGDDLNVSHSKNAFFSRASLKCRMARCAAGRCAI